MKIREFSEPNPLDDGPRKYTCAETFERDFAIALREAKRRMSWRARLIYWAARMKVKWLALWI